VREPGRVAYVVLLASTTLGTLSSTIITSPINMIAGDLDVSARQIVFAVSAFTLAMVVFSPLAGWLCERLGARTFLISSLVLMVLAGVGAALSPNLWVLVGMRALQGVACSAIPPAVQQTLGTFWTQQRARVMAAWASAIGIGQALGPPLGGFVADLAGWRGVFVTHALLSALLATLLYLRVPAAPRGRPPMHVSGMLTLVIGVGGMVAALTWAGQGGAAVVAGALGVAGAGALALHARLARRSPRALVEPRLLVEARYLRSTASAATVMACLGVMIVATPLHLGREFGMSPSQIGIVTLALAASMALSAPLSSRIGERITARRVLHLGLAGLVVGPVTMAFVLSAPSQSEAVAGAVLLLIFTGGAIGAVQAVAGLGVMRSEASAHGAALGIHNMMRFAGLAVGYAWVALTYPAGHLALVYGGPTVLAGSTLALVMAGPPAPPIPGDEVVLA
jgi:MFS family permease